MALFNLFYRCIVLASITVLLGCSAPQAQDLWQDYQQRLLRLGGDRITPPASSAPQRPRWPAQRLIHSPVPEWRTDLLGWIDLMDCELSTLVAQRNSGLGRVQHPSLRLAYEVEFISRAEHCLTTLPSDNDMVPWLAEAVAGKQAALPALYWNATLGTPEWQTALAPQSVPASLPLPVDGAALAAVLSDWALQLGRTAGGAIPATAGLEQQLQGLTVNRPGLLTDALRTGTAGLRQSTAVLAQVDTRWLCPHQRASTRARYFHNVFSTIYGGRIQPWLSAVWRETRPPADALLSLRAALPANNAGQATRQWIDQWLQLREDFRQALDAHVGAWQRLLGDCSLMPGQAPLASTGRLTVGAANDAGASAR